MRVCGIDEAGRGPVIGPLVVAAVCVSDEEHLRKLGVRDSKKLQRKRREELARLIEKVAIVETIMLEPREIDELMDILNLNSIEAGVFAKLIDKITPEVVYVDAADANETHFRQMIEERCTWKCKIVAEHKADEKYPVVSAASIVAKVRRDAEVDRIKEEIGVDFGSGYPSDPRTVKYLQNLIAENRSLPKFVRKHWGTVSRVKDEVATKKLEEFK
ncbi:MAG: ribonuclease HII [Thermoplasmata archaeon]|nr:ribonuclease HII [Thermoplasmata archaeon]